MPFAIIYRRYKKTANGIIINAPDKTVLEFKTYEQRYSDIDSVLEKHYGGTMIETKDGIIIGYSILRTITIGSGEAKITLPDGKSFYMRESSGFTLDITDGSEEPGEPPSITFAEAFKNYLEEIAEIIAQTGQATDIIRTDETEYRVF